MCLPGNASPKRLIYRKLEYRSVIYFRCHVPLNTLDTIGNQASQSTQLRVTRVFFFHYYLATSTTNWAQMFTGLLFCAFCWDTPSEKNGLWQLPIVSSAFNQQLKVGSNVALLLLEWEHPPQFLFNTTGTPHSQKKWLTNLHIMSLAMCPQTEEVRDMISKNALYNWTPDMNHSTRLQWCWFLTYRNDYFTNQVKTPALSLFIYFT